VAKSAIKRMQENDLDSSPRRASFAWRSCHEEWITCGEKRWRVEWNTEIPCGLIVELRVYGRRDETTGHAWMTALWRGRTYRVCMNISRNITRESVRRLCVAFADRVVKEAKKRGGA